MLSLLRLADFAIVDRIELELGPGLTAITGETGAGKSLLVGALELLVGGRASAKVVRAGGRAAEIEAIFEEVGHPATLHALGERGLSLDEGALVVRRVIAAGGGRRSYLCGRLASAADLRAVVGPLVDLCGQHRHSRLLSPEHHLLTVDRFAGLDECRRRHREAWLRWRRAEDERERLLEGAREREQRRDFLCFCADELERAGVVAGEVASLEAQARRLHGAADLVAGSLAAHAALAEDGGVRDRLASVARRLGELTDLDAGLEAAARRAEVLVVLADELAADLERYADRVEVDEAHRERVDERLGELLGLCRKYGGSEEALLARQLEIERELAERLRDDGRLSELERILVELRSTVEQGAAELSRARADAAGPLTAAAHEVLAALAMPAARLEFELCPLPEPGPTGADRLHLRLASNAGEPALPLAEIASGGELSRVMLALQRACAGRAEPLTSVYDEVDAGIGGETGSRLGAFLHAMSRSRQVLCITHLPQVAARADRQLHVSKLEREGRTVSRVDPVVGDDRVRALARMLGGDRDTAISHARGLLRAR